MSVNKHYINISKSLKYLEEMEELRQLSLQVIKQLGLEVSEKAYRALNIMAWLLELYVRKVGETEVLKRWKNELNRPSIKSCRSS